MDKTDEKRINTQLIKQGLRIARSNEAGWFLTVMQGTDLVRVWVTDEIEQKETSLT